jgi:endonuclease YncB( thermonuclease family)
MGTSDINARWKFHKGILMRGTGFVMAVAVVGGALFLGSMLRHSSHAPPPPVTADSGQDEKDQARVILDGAKAAARTTPAITSVSIWHPGKMEQASTDDGAQAFLVTDSPTEEWRMQEFTFVAVVDGRTFSAGGMTLRLAGLELPPADQVCRTLDNRLEECAVRAATQLELLTRSRTLACRYRMTTSSEAVGSCRIGAQDLAERMIRTGYVRTADAGAAVSGLRRALPGSD